MTQRTLKNRFEITTSVLALALGGMASLVSGCSSPASAAPAGEAAPIDVDAVVAEARAVPRTLALTGTLVANREAQVAADGVGRVVATFVERGDRVAAGALLARLDARSAALSRAEAAASAAGLVAQEQNAKLECDRAERLFAGNAISRAERDRLTASCATSTFSVDAARARASMAEKAIGDSLIRAPFAGSISVRSVAVGEYVAPGQPVATVVELDTLRLELAVPETATAAVGVGQSVEFEVAAHPGREFTGKLRRLSPSLRPSSRDQIVEVEVDNREGVLRPGMFAVARLPIGSDQRPTLPEGAVVGHAPSERVFVVGKDSRVEERVVSTGERRGGFVPIIKGLNAGEEVVNRPSERVRDGVRVK